MEKPERTLIPELDEFNKPDPTNTKYFESLSTPAQEYWRTRFSINDIRKINDEIRSHITYRLEKKNLIYASTCVKVVMSLSTYIKGEDTKDMLIQMNKLLLGINKELKVLY